MWGFGEKQEACSVLAADKDACTGSWVKAEERTYFFRVSRLQTQ